MTMHTSRVAGSSDIGLSSDRRPRVAMLGQGPWQVLLGLLGAVVLPAAVRWPDSAFEFAAGSPLINAMIGTAAALLSGYYILRRFATFPGLQIFSVILPAARQSG